MFWLLCWWCLWTSMLTKCLNGINNMITVGKTNNRINYKTKRNNEYDKKYSIYLGNVSGTNENELDDTLDGDKYFFDTNNKTKAAPSSTKKDLDNLEKIKSFIDNNVEFWTCKANQKKDANNVEYICFNCVQECQTCTTCVNCQACNICNSCTSCNGCNSCDSSCNVCTNCTGCTTCDNGQ